LLVLRTPRTFTGEWSEAHELALRESEPVFVPVVPYADDRGWSLMNMMTGVLGAQGQINYSLQYPGVVKAWHRHQKQTDFWCCVHGHLKAGVCRPSDDARWLVVFGERKPGVLVIPPTLWHGAAAVAEAPAGLLYFVTHRYDAKQPDEERLAHDAISGFPWGIRHG